jgi:succinate dehydrogenase / fumarate reductase membrane anchor subunit
MEIVIETPNSPRKRSKGANWEKIGWMYMRLSGVVLIFLIFGHLLVNLFLPSEGVRSIDFAFVAGKWASPFWQVWDGLMLWLAIIHGTNGMRTLVNDYAGREGVRKTLNAVLFITGAALIILGTLVITTFDPCIDPNVHTYLPDLVCAK